MLKLTTLKLHKRSRTQLHKKGLSFFKIFTLLSSSLLSSSIWAGVVSSLQHTAVTVQPGVYEARGQGDFLLSRGGGVNVSGHFRTGLIEDMLDFEGFVGSGKTDFKAGFLTQFNLLPDLPGQVAFAFLGGFTFMLDDYRSKDTDSIKVVNLSAIVSKKFLSSFGSVSPYGGLQLEMLFKEGGDDFPLTAVIGAEWTVTDTDPWAYFSELDLDLRDSIYVLGFGAAYRF